MAERLLCSAAPVCRGSSRIWREASVVAAVMDSHRRVALLVTTGTWTRVRLTYGNNKDLLRVSVPLLSVPHGFAFLSLCLVSQWTLIQKQQWWMLRTQPRKKLKCKQHKYWCKYLCVRTDRQQQHKHHVHILCTYPQGSGIYFILTANFPYIFFFNWQKRASAHILLVNFRLDHSQQVHKQTRSWPHSWCLDDGRKKLWQSTFV